MKRSGAVLEELRETNMHTNGAAHGIEATKAQAEGKTTVLEMMVTRELGDPFRRDALAMPTRHLAKYKPTAA